jgi:hypothetical protein
MRIKELWRIPVPSTAVQGEQLLYTSADALLRFDYYDAKKDDTIFNCGIFFKNVVGFKHDSEGFSTALMDAYDRLVEIIDSDWINEYRKINSRVANIFSIKHYAIFLKNCGLYEFIAAEFAIQEARKGGLNDLF